MALLVTMVGLSMSYWAIVTELKLSYHTEYLYVYIERE